MCETARTGKRQWVEEVEHDGWWTAPCGGGKGHRQHVSRQRRTETSAAASLLAFIGDVDESGVGAQPDDERCFRLSVRLSSQILSNFGCLWGELGPLPSQTTHDAASGI